MITRTLDMDRIFASNDAGTITERRARRIAGEKRLKVLPYERIAEWVQSHGLKPEDVSTVGMAIIEDDGQRYLRVFTYDRNATGGKVIVDGSEPRFLKTERSVPLVVEPPFPDLWITE